MTNIPVGILEQQGGGAAPAFEPTDIADLQLWLDGDDAATITEVSGTITTWADKSVEGHDIAQGTVARQPITSTVNGNNSILFDGGQEHLDNVTTIDISCDPGTLAIVYTPTTVTGDNDRIFTLRDGFAEVVRVERDTADLQVIFGTGGASAVLSDAASQAIDETHWAIARFQVSGSGDCDLLTDDGSTDTDTGVASVGAVDKVSVAALDNSNNAWAGHIHEIIFYNRFLSASERTQIEDYLNDKWTTS